MPIDPDIYHAFLTIQAENSFDHEIALYRPNPIWTKATTVLDFGCGSGRYTKLLALKFPQKTFIGIDNNAALIERANRCNSARNVHYIHGTCDTPLPQTFDFAFARFVVSYLPNRNTLWSWLDSQMPKKNSGIVLVDAADQFFSFAPEMPAFQAEVLKFYDRVNEGGGSRDITAATKAELSTFGFSQVQSLPFIVSSDWPGRRHPMLSYLSLGTEVDTGFPMPKEIQSELHKWAVTDDSYVQYGETASLYTR